MIEIDIPSSKKLVLKHLCLDLNGTIAFDGRIIEGVPERLEELEKRLELHVITADTFGNARKLLDKLPVAVTVIAGKNQGRAKLAFVKKLGTEYTVSMGNGYNDRLMLEKSSLSMAIIGREGASPFALRAAQIVIFSILDGLDLLLNTNRLIATMRD